MSYSLPTTGLDDFIRDCEQNLRRPLIEWDGQKAVALFSPDLAPAEQDTYTALLRLHRSRLGVTATEFAALQPDIVGLRAFVNLAAPSAAQTTAATKAIIRVLRAILD